MDVKRQMLVSKQKKKIAAFLQLSFYKPYPSSKYSIIYMNIHILLSR